MRIIFCSNPLESKTVDPDYQEEFKAALETGFSVSLLNFEDLCLSEDPQRAIRNISEAELGEEAIYRGWMMKPRHFEALWGALRKKGIMLLNNAQEYRHCHFLPESYSVIECFTPKTVWIQLNGSLEELIFQRVKPNY